MLHAALRERLGPHVKQAGSLVAPDRLRFDFTHFAPLDAGDLEAIEWRVNEKIQQNLEVRSGEMAFNEAIERGAVAFFGDKYGDRVRVLEIPGYSMELCGGTHLHHTGQAGLFVIIAESSIASGTRRIEALAGPRAVEHVRRQRQIIEGLSSTLRTRPEELVATAERLREELRSREKEIDQLRSQLATGTGSHLDQDSGSRKIRDVTVWTPEPVRNYHKKQHRQYVDAFKNKNRGRRWVAISGAINDDKVSLIVEVSPDLVDRCPADGLIERLAPLIEGRGGGKPERAEAGGRFPERLPTLYEEGRRAVQEALDEG
jgi:alanyl-tRNA synthetase